MSLDFVGYVCYERIVNRKLKAAVLEAVGRLGPCTHYDTAFVVQVSVQSTKTAFQHLRSEGLLVAAGTRRDCLGSGSRKQLWQLRAGVSSQEGAIDEYHLPVSEEERFWSRVNKDGPIPDRDIYGDIGPCWLWTAGCTSEDYGQFTRKGTSQGEGAHRVSWSYQNGPIPPGVNVLHTCDNRPCVNPGHLYPGTQQDNRMDALRRGRDNTARGDANGSRTRPDRRAKAEGHGNSKLTWDVVDQMRALYANKVPQSEISRRFAVSPATVHAVVHNLRWVRSG